MDKFNFEGKNQGQTYEEENDNYAGNDVTVRIILYFILFYLCY